MEIGSVTIFLYPFPNPNSHRALQRRLMIPIHTLSHKYKKISLSFKNPNLLYQAASVPVLCPGRRHLYFPRLLHKHAWKDSLEQQSFPLLSKHAEMQETHGESVSSKIYNTFSVDAYLIVSVFYDILNHLKRTFSCF